MCESTDRRGWSRCPSLSTPPRMARSVNLRAGTLEDLAGPSREAVIVLRSCWRLVAVGALIAAASSMSCSTILAAGEDGVLDSTFGVAEALPGVVELPDLDAAFRGALQSNGDLVVASNDVGPATRGLVRIDEFGQRDMSFGAGGLVDLGAPTTASFAMSTLIRLIGSWSLSTHG